MTDTAAYSDVVFELFWVLGYRFSPCLADIGGARFWRIERSADYGAFNSALTQPRRYRTHRRRLARPVLSGCRR